MNGRPQHYCWLVIIVLCQIAGCAMPGRQQSTAKKTYLLQIDQRPADPRIAISHPSLTLRINTPRSAPGFTTARMAYTNESKRLEYFAFHEWVATPARMLESLFATQAVRAGVFGTVLSGSPDIKTDYRLDAEGLRLLQVFDSGASHSALSVNVFLIDVGSRSISNSRQFSYVEAADHNGPEAGVAAANRVVERLLDDLTVFLSESIDGDGDTRN